MQKDNPIFAQNGLIRINVKRGDFKETLKSLTNYIESLFLKEMGEGEVNEDIYTSLGVVGQRRGIEKSSKPGKAGSTKGKGSATGVHDSTRREEPAEGTGRGTDTDDVEAVSDPKANGEGESGS